MGKKDRKKKERKKNNNNKKHSHKKPRPFNNSKLVSRYCQMKKIVELTHSDAHFTHEKSSYASFSTQI